MSFVTVAISAVTAFGQANAGRTAKLQGQLQGQADDYSAQVEQQSALETARIIRKAGRRQLGAANAAYAGAGVKVGEGSAGEVERQINLDVEHDAYQALLDGSRRATNLRLQGSGARAQGELSEAAGYVNAAGTVLGGFGQSLRASGWRSQGAGYSGTQAPARVVNRDVRY